MIKWWVAMMIGVVTMCIGYWLGKVRARGLLKMSEQLAEFTSVMLIKAEEALEQIKNEQQSEGQER